jgi:hypothetical protein
MASAGQTSAHGRLLAVHAHHRHGLDTGGTIDELEMNHRFAAMRIAFGAGLHARLTTDAAARIDEEPQVIGLHCCGSSMAS